MDLSRRQFLSLGLCAAIFPAVAVVPIEHKLMCVEGFTLEELQTMPPPSEVRRGKPFREIDPRLAALAGPGEEIPPGVALIDLDAPITQQDRKIALELEPLAKRLLPQARNESR